MFINTVALLALGARSVVAFGDVATFFKDESSSLGPFPLGIGLTRGASWFDFNNDNFLDLIVPDLGDVALFKNNGDGTFENVAEAAGLIYENAQNALIGDLDNDGFQDVIFIPPDDIVGDNSVANGGPLLGGGEITGTGSVVVYRNNGDGTFEDVTETSQLVGPENSMSGAIADYNNDGFLDIFMTGAGNSFLFPIPISFSGNKLFMNNGDFTFTDVSEEAGIDGFFDGPNFETEEHAQGCTTIFHDYNNDRHPDIFVSNCFSYADPGFYVFKNNGDGTFTDVAEEIGFRVDGVWMGLTIGDINGDGSLDFYAGSTGGYINLPPPFESGDHYPHGTWTKNDDYTFTVDLASDNDDFTIPTAADDSTIPNHEFNWGSSLVDVDNDGDNDLVTIGSLAPFGFVGAGVGNPGYLFLNDGWGTFDQTSLFDASLENSFSTGLASADYDNDGRMDLLVMCIGYEGSPDSGVFSQAVLLRNTGALGNYLTVKLVGTTSNRDGIGALVKVGSQVREVKSGSSTLSVEQMWPHFGLGSQTGTVLVQVIWPSGIDETFEVDANQLTTLTEGWGQ